MKKAMFQIFLSVAVALVALVLLVIYSRVTKRTAKKPISGGGQLSVWVCKGRLGWSDDFGPRGIAFDACWWQPIGGYFLSSSGPNIAPDKKQWSNVPWKSETAPYLYVLRARFNPPVTEPDEHRYPETLDIPLTIMSYHDTITVTWTRHYDYNSQGLLLAVRDDYMGTTAYAEEK